MKRLAVALIVAISLAGCSNSIETKPPVNGQCEQVTKNKVFGVTYSTDRNRLNCG